MLPDYLMTTLFHKHLLLARSLVGREASTVWARLVGMLPLCNSIQWLPTLTGNGGYIPNELASDPLAVPIETAGVLIQTDCFRKDKPRRAERTQSKRQKSVQWKLGTDRKARELWLREYVKMEKDLGIGHRV